MSSAASSWMLSASDSRPVVDIRDIRANFCGLHDFLDTVIFDPYLLSLWFRSEYDRFHQWLNLKRAVNLTHVVVCPVANYPTITDIQATDVRGLPNVFGDFVGRLIEVERFTPIVMMTTGDGGSAEDIDRYWPGLLRALQPYDGKIVLGCGFEVVGPRGQAGWRSADLSRGLKTIKTALPKSPLLAHFQPERASGASYGGDGFPDETPSGYVWHPYPDGSGRGAFIEDDDPWQGDEPGFWTSHGGELVDVFCYQTPHGGKLLDGDGWEDRWREIVERLGIGARGWRKVPLCFFESIAMDFAHGNCGPQAALPLRLRAQQICQDSGASCTWGNG